VAADEEDGVPGVLDGIRVLELSTVIMAPYAAQLLGDLGADVIKIETGAGDLNRNMGGPPGMSGTCLTINRNKRSVRLDLKKPAEMEAFLRILDTCDVLLTNLRPGAVKRLGLTYEEVSASRPRLVYCQAAGFRSGSAEEDRPAYDDIIQAATGLPRLTEAATGTAAFLPTIMGDKVSGATLLSAVLAALLHRERTGRGQRVEVAMFDAVLAFTLTEHLAESATFRGPAGYSRVLTSTRGPYRTKDGYLAVLPYTDAQWERLLTAAGHGELMEEPYLATYPERLRQAERAYATLGEIIAERTTAEWLEICQAADVAATVVPSVNEIVEDETLHRGMITTAEHPAVGPYRVVGPNMILDDAPLRVRRHAPVLGEHTAEVLAEVGYDPAAIDEITG
jgi:crotonobetainyl-CoA:carnitine CoA-transferase CaiB-like acyl-CoA transferase